MERRIWDVHVPTQNADEVIKGLKDRVAKVGGKVSRTRRFTKNGSTMVNVNLETPEGEAAWNKLVKVIRWVNGKGGLINGS